MSIIDRLSAAQTSLLKRRQRARMASRDKPFKPKPPAKPRARRGSTGAAVSFKSPGDRRWSLYYWQSGLLRGPAGSLVEGSERAAFLIWESANAASIYRRDAKGGWRYAAGMGRAGRPVEAARVDDAHRRRGELPPGSEPAAEWDAGASGHMPADLARQTSEHVHDELGLKVDPVLQKYLDRGELDKPLLWKTTRVRPDAKTGEPVRFEVAMVRTVRQIVDNLQRRAQRQAARALGDPDGE